MKRGLTSLAKFVAVLSAIALAATFVFYRATGTLPFGWQISESRGNWVKPGTLLDTSKSGGVFDRNIADPDLVKANRTSTSSSTTSATDDPPPLPPVMMSGSKSIPLISNSIDESLLVEEEGPLTPEQLKSLLQAVQETEQDRPNP